MGALGRQIPAIGLMALLAAPAPELRLLAPCWPAAVYAAGMAGMGFARTAAGPDLDGDLWQLWTASDGRFARAIAREGGALVCSVAIGAGWEPAAKGQGT